MKLSSVNPYIRHAMLCKSGYFTRNEPSVCYDCRVFWFRNIAGHVTVGGEKYNITNNMAVYFPPETQYEIEVNFGEDSVFIVLNFDLTCRNEHMDQSLGTAVLSGFDKSLVPPYELPKELSAPIVRHLPDIRWRLEQIADGFVLKNNLYRERASAQLKLCLMDFVCEETGVARSRICRDVLSYIHENYSDTLMTNESISSHFGYHPYYLSNLVREETGRSLHQFLIYYRLRVATDMLINSDLGIAEVGWRSGFASPAYFGKIFRREMKMTPLAYRKRNREG